MGKHYYQENAHAGRFLDVFPQTESIFAKVVSQ